MPFLPHYTEKGFGTPLILLHGNGENSSFFKNQIEYFSSFYRVIAVDTRGHGKSPHGNAPFTLNTFCEDLKNLLDFLNIKKADILGFSDGGNIALIFTLKYPQYVTKLILNGANLYPGGLKKTFLLPVKALYAFYAAAAHFNKRALRRKELLSLMVNEPNISPEELKAVKCPVLVIAGTHDLIKEKHTKLIADSVTGSRLCFLNGDHAVAKNNSVEFNKTIERFLND